MRWAPWASEHKAEGFRHQNRGHRRRSVRVGALCRCTLGRQRGEAGVAALRGPGDTPRDRGGPARSRPEGLRGCCSFPRARRLPPASGTRIRHACPRCAGDRPSSPDSFLRSRPGLTTPFRASGDPAKAASTSQQAKLVPALTGTFTHLNGPLHLRAWPRCALRSRAVRGPRPGPRRHTVPADSREGRIDLFGLNSSNQVQHAYAPAGSGWRPYDNIGATMQGTGAAASWGTGRVDLVARGASRNTLWHRQPQRLHLVEVAQHRHPLHLRAGPLHLGAEPPWTSSPRTGTTRSCTARGTAGPGASGRTSARRTPTTTSPPSPPSPGVTELSGRGRNNRRYRRTYT